ncbi:MAG: DUF4870 domain-containing protein [Clostridiales Family XIII bacterium]|nr:DUF4870 domain-containing protein [Clostridiales Family XIII bacterium]
MAYCNNCGQTIHAGEQYCVNCGMKIETEVFTETVSTASEFDTASTPEASSIDSNEDDVQDFTSNLNQDDTTVPNYGQQNSRAPQDEVPNYGQQYTAPEHDTAQQAGPSQYGYSGNTDYNQNSQNGQPHGPYYRGSGSAEPDDSFEPYKVQSVLAYIPCLFFIPLVACPKSTFARYHANQGLVLLITWFVYSVVSKVIKGITLAITGGYSSWFGFGNPLYSAVNGILSLVNLGLLALMIIGMVRASRGEKTPLPIIGGIKLL